MLQSPGEADAGVGVCGRSAGRFWIAYPSLKIGKYLYNCTLYSSMLNIKIKLIFTFTLEGQQDST